RRSSSCRRTARAGRRGRSAREWRRGSRSRAGCSRGCALRSPCDPRWSRRGRDEPLLAGLRTAPRNAPVPPARARVRDAPRGDRALADRARRARRGIARAGSCRDRAPAARADRARLPRDVRRAPHERASRGRAPARGSRPGEPGRPPRPHGRPHAAVGRARLGGRRAHDARARARPALDTGRERARDRARRVDRRVRDRAAGRPVDRRSGGRGSGRGRDARRPGRDRGRGESRARDRPAKRRKGGGRERAARRDGSARRVRRRRAPARRAGGAGGRGGGAMTLAFALLLAALFAAPLFAHRRGRASARAPIDLLAPARVTAVFHLVTIVPYLLLVALDESVVDPLVRQNADVGELQPAIAWYALVQAVGFLALLAGTRSRRAARLAGRLPVIATDARPQRERLAIACALAISGIGFAVFVAQVGGLDFLLRNLDRRTALTAGAGYVLSLLNLLFFAIAIAIVGMRRRRTALKWAFLGALVLAAAIVFSSLGGRKA